MMKCPYFLVAMPRLEDAYFSKKVLLVIEHDDEGAFAVVINSPVVDDNEALQQLKVELKDLNGETMLEMEDNVYWGGPVNEDSILVIHRLPELSSQSEEIGEGLYLSQNLEIFQSLVEDKSSEQDRRFFVGSSSWGAGQLESELRSASWVMVPYDPKFLFYPMDPKEDINKWSYDLWKKVSLHGGFDPLTLMHAQSADLVN